MNDCAAIELPTGSQLMTRLRNRTRQVTNLASSQNEHTNGTSSLEKINFERRKLTELIDLILFRLSGNDKEDVHCV